MSSSKPLRNKPNRSFTHRAAFAALFAFGMFSLASCAPMDEEGRKTSEAGGTIPWNRPAGWEGGGALGSQMQQMQGQ